MSDANKPIKIKVFITVLLIFSLVVTSSTSIAANVQQGELERDSKEFLYFKNYYEKAENESERLEGLYQMYVSDRIASFPYVLESLRKGTEAFKALAAEFIGTYYAEIPHFRGSEFFKDIERPSEIINSRGEVIELLKKLKNSSAVDIKINAMVSLAGMGEADSQMVVDAFDIATAKNMHNWVLALKRWHDNEVSRERMFRPCRSQALRLLLWLKMNNLFYEQITRTMNEKIRESEFIEDDLRRFKNRIDKILEIPDAPNNSIPAQIDDLPG